MQTNSILGRRIEPGEKAAVLFDMDGTLALIDHRRHHVEARPKDWVAFYAGISDDEPNVPLINMVHAMRGIGYVALIVTGRPRDHQGATEGWLEKWFVNYDELYMRDVGDYRSDDVVKRELLGKIRGDGFIPVMAVDDRDRVVAMWRAEGIVCLQAAPGDF